MHNIKSEGTPGCGGGGGQGQGWGAEALALSGGCRVGNAAFELLGGGAFHLRVARGFAAALD